MRHVGLERRQIIATIEQMLGHLPTPDQLATILENDNIQPLGTETERLCALMTQLHGSSYIFEVASGERAAVLTITPFEMEMLARFGDVVFLDGTMIRNSLGWTTFPITLITESFEITSGGLLFTAFEDVATFDWLIATLFDVITGTGCPLRTVMTDEDSALVLSMQNFQQAHPEVAHRLCVFHKRRNFQKKVDALTKDPKVQADAIRLFQKIMYSKRRDSVIQSIHQLEHLFPRLHDYIEGEIQDRLQFCSEAFRGGALTLGINHTGSSESANKMLKSSPIGPGFDGIREAHARNHELKISASQAKTTRQFRREHFLERDYQLTLSRALCDKIDSCVARSQKWNVHRKLGHVHWFVATYRSDSNRAWEILYDEEQPPRCECNEVSGTGLPCPHIIALFERFGPPGAFPVQIIAPRWLVASPEVSLPPLPLLRIEEIAEIERIAGELLPDSDASDDDGIPPPPMPVPSDGDTTRDKYNRMFYVAKEITRKASVNDAQYDPVLEQLTGILSSLTVSEDGEVRDASGRPKGRPRKRGHSRPDPDPLKHCPLCDLDGHSLRDCPHYNLFSTESTLFTPDSTGKTRCALCQHTGHNRAKCPVLSLARRRLRDEPGHAGSGSP
jgi:hypothetical protein